MNLVRIASRISKIRLAVSVSDIKNKMEKADTMEYPQLSESDFTTVTISKDAKKKVENQFKNLENNLNVFMDCWKQVTEMHENNEDLPANVRSRLDEYTKSGKNMVDVYKGHIKDVVELKEEFGKIETMPLTDVKKLVSEFDKKGKTIAEAMDDDLVLFD